MLYKTGSNMNKKIHHPSHQCQAKVQNLSQKFETPMENPWTTENSECHLHSVRYPSRIVQVHGESLKRQNQ